MYEDATRVGTTTATRQIPVSELLARHRGEQRVSQPQWDAPTACETTDVIPVVQDEYYLDEPYAATGYSEAYEYVEERADDVRPFVAGVSPDTDRFPLPVLDNPHAPEEQTLYAPIDVEAMDAEAGYTEIRRGADPQPETALIDAETVETPSCDDTPSREIYIRELLRREGRLPREQRRKQAPKIAAAAAGVAALCGAVAASIVHVQNADTQSSNAGGGVPLTVVDGGGPHGQALDAPLAPRGTEAVTQDNSAGGAAATTTTKPRVAPYVQANQKAQQQSGGTSTTPPTTTTDTPPPSSSDTPPASSTAPSSTPPSSGVNNNNSTPPSTPTNGGHSSNNSTPPPSTSNNGLLDGIVGTVSGLLG
ncbi:hypothetical protein BCF44_101612 [Kutzneria buriramensis]|uniref:Uncharacterized protein n=1 Tax=Kutzneria buriramensis TaxID=1045776 RepID=A0A3E0IA39_9PSEU|nr:hypothetical protein BCF44_101612 [Kutzneria buriramensis]